MIDKTELKKLLETSAGMGLQEFIVEHISALNKLSAIKECDNAEDQAVEVKAAKKALTVLADIFYEILDTKRFEQIEKLEENKLYSL